MTVLAPIAVGAVGVSSGASGMAYATGRALGFLRQMLAPLVDVTADDEIRLSRLYPVDYTGPVEGVFGFRDAPATEQLGFITVGNPIEPVPPSFGGVFYGRVAPSAALGDTALYRVRLMKHTDGDYDTSPPTTQNLDSAGFFALDAPADTGTGLNTQAGDWRIRLERISDGTTRGALWPSAPTYADSEIALLSISDASELVAVQAARQDGSFRFDSSTPGRKRAQLRQATDDVILADDCPTVGALRSYRVAPGEPAYGTNFVHQTYTYDQAVALFALIALGERELAYQAVGGLLELQVTDGGAHDGGFRFSGQQLAPHFGDPSFRTGAHACALFALCRYVNAHPEDQTRPYGDRIQRALDYVETLRSTDGPTLGMVLGGSGTYPGDGQIFEPSIALTWAATEHHLDLYHAYDEALAAGFDVASERDQIADILLGPLWWDEEERFYQGMQASEVDEADPLDLHSWGSVFLGKVGETGRRDAVLADAALAPFRWTTPTGISGYAPAYDGVGYEGTIPNVWSEGTFSLAHAFFRAGDFDRWRTTLDGLLGDQQPDGSWRYVWRPDPTNDMTTSRATIGAAWAVLAIHGDGIW